MLGDRHAVAAYSQPQYRSETQCLWLHSLVLLLCCVKHAHTHSFSSSSHLPPLPSLLFAPHSPQTADLILAEMSSPLHAERRAELKERCFGCLEGKPTSELRRAALEAQQSDVEFTPIGGETLPCVQRRANAFCDYLCQRVGSGEIHSPRMESTASFSHFTSCCSSDSPADVNGPRHHTLVPAQNGSTEDEAEGKVGTLVPWDEVQLQGRDDQPHIMVVSHGGFMKCLFKHFYDKHKCKNLYPQGFKSTPPNTSLNSFVFTIKWVPRRPPAVADGDAQAGGEWKVSALECTALHDNRGQLQ